LHQCRTRRGCSGDFKTEQFLARWPQRENACGFSFSFMQCPRSTIERGVYRFALPRLTSAPAARSGRSSSSSLSSAARKLCFIGVRELLRALRQWSCAGR
jgi:hypothetical protein